MESLYLIHYGELALKQGNRRLFEDRLVRNLESACRPVVPVKVTRLYGRLSLRPEVEDFDHQALSERIRDVFGITWFARALGAEASFENLCAITEAILPPGEHSFGVKAKKAEQTWSRGATETARDLGADVVARRGWKVDLTAPDIWIRAEIASGRVFVTVERQQGLRGLPVGSSGRVLCLLSGGIDSPVAAFKMMSRGCEVEALHFHSAPYTSRASQDKVTELARELTRYQPTVRLGMVPFAGLQQEIVQKTPQQYRVLLYRRFMLRIAERLARRRKIVALVTGESVGQVASQTLTNMNTVDSVAGLPVLRPLVGSDKEEISAIARRAGTFEISIQPHEDCCSFLMPRRPATTSRPDELEEVEQALDVEGLLRSVLDQVEFMEIDRR
ncbi:MAG: tRNA 4-thiouridine(8) synthase ThiI [Planctomycetes bacterium]|nr:tRNA 4-thiouridine(8) synthase ThiI [Planctomycetota bacterium]